MIDFKLYLITDRRVVRDNGILSAVEEALSGGVRAVQLREKDLKIRELLDLAYRMRDLTKRYGALLFINDRVDVAIAVGADGVHLGRDSIPPSAVRRVSNDLIIGVSTHSVAEAIEAEKEGADFITLGPVFYTPSKAGYGEPLGLNTLKKVCSSVSLPVLAIGGIKPDTIKEVIGSGAKGVAVISAILGADNIKDAAEKFLRCLR
ncbi:MAG: thiamine phosphate synthase [Thermodesulfovibrionales bacterium]